MQSTKGTLQLPKNKFSGASNTPSQRASSLPAPVTPALGELILIRGLPGSGKSTMAKTLALVGYQHFEADQYFEVNGQYQYEAARITNAHDWCKTMSRKALAAGKRVVVSNTFTTLKELEPYLAMTKNNRVIEAQGKWQNQHGVPVEMLERMAQRWEALPLSLVKH